MAGKFLDMDTDGQETDPFLDGDAVETLVFNRPKKLVPFEWTPKKVGGVKVSLEVILKDGSSKALKEVPNKGIAFVCFGANAKGKCTLLVRGTKGVALGTVKL